MYKEDLALTNLKWLICHKSKPNQILIEYKLNRVIVRSDIFSEFIYLSGFFQIFSHFRFFFVKIFD